MVTFDKNVRLTNLIKGISVVLLYFIVSLFTTLPLELIGIHYDSLPTFAKEIYGVGMEIILILMIYLILRDEFHRAIEDIKVNHFKYFSSNFKYYLLGVGAMMIANMLIMSLGGGMSENESTIRDQFATNPIYTFISAVFLAPVLEESVFRLGFRNIFKNGFIFIVMSGFVFGGLHLLGNFDNPLIFLHLIAYSGCGVAFAYIMTKTNNILVSMGLHFMHNGILMSLQVLLLLLT